MFLDIFKIKFLRKHISLDKYFYFKKIYSKSLQTSNITKKLFKSFLYCPCVNTIIYIEEHSFN